MKLTLISHASVLLELPNARLLTDPWLEGDVFDASWSLLFPPALSQAQRGEVTHLWISHEHPDHFHPASLARFPAAQRRRMTVLLQRHHSTRLRDALRELGFGQVVELPLRRWLTVPELPGVELLCVSSGLIDSALALRAEGTTILNLNDCYVDRRARADLARRVGPVEVLLTQFSIASWAGNQDQRDRPPAADWTLRGMRRQIEALRPRVTIPFASFVRFSHVENAHMNRWVNLPSHVCADLDDLDGRIAFLGPGDSWSPAPSANPSSDAVPRLDALFRATAGAPVRRDRPCSLDELLTAGSARLRRLRRAFGPLVWLAPPVSFYLDDLDRAVELDLRRARARPVDRTRAECYRALRSRALLHALRRPLGFDALEESGRFDQVQPADARSRLFTLARLHACELSPPAILRQLPRRRFLSYWWSKRAQALDLLAEKVRQRQVP